jgi:GTP-binding protein
VLNKVDLVDAMQLAEQRERIIAALEWTGPVYEISALAAQGTQRLCQDMMLHLESVRAAETADPASRGGERDGAAGNAERGA